MERKTFIRVAGLSSLAVYLGLDVLASDSVSYTKIIDIDDPIIHVRHGMFNLQDPAVKSKEFLIKRDVFTRNGLDHISDDRMTSLTLTDGATEAFGLIDRDKLECNFKQISSVHLEEKKEQTVFINKPCLLFSEFEDIQVNGKILQKNKALFVQNEISIDILSVTRQSVILYYLHNDSII